MKQLPLLLFLGLSYGIFAQKMDLSEEIYIGNSDGFGLIGKYNDRVLFFNIESNKVKIRAFDAKMRKIWDKEIEPDRRNNATILDIIPGRQDFSLVYQFRRKNRDYIKVHKYDGQVKLLDSTIVHDWGRDLLSPKVQFTLSEDKKVMLLYEVEENHSIEACVVSLDSLKTIWSTKNEVGTWESENIHHQAVVTNKGQAFFIREENNRFMDANNHRFSVTRVTEGGVASPFLIDMKDYLVLDVKFSFDNANQLFVAAGVYSTKNYFRAQGYFSFSASAPSLIPPMIKFHPFDDEFVTSIVGKKTSDNKGVTDLRVQEIVHRRDGGFLAILEQVRVVERRTSTPSMMRYRTRFDDPFLSLDYFYDNIAAISVNADGTTHWKTVMYKKQSSQDDEGRYCSYFLLKTPSALRFLFNDDVERSTTTSEYVLSGSGQAERHIIFNTEGQNVLLRFRDAMQVAANEVIVLSDDRRRIRLIKIQY